MTADSDSRRALATLAHHVARGNLTLDDIHADIADIARGNVHLVAYFHRQLLAERDTAPRH